MKRLIILLLFITSCNSKNTWKCIEGNCENGEGTRVWTDHGSEKGHWMNGKLNGQGYQYFGTTSEFSGDTYSGEFKDNLYHGQGTYYDKSENSKYTGQFKAGKINGKGKYTWGKLSKSPNSYYTGEWKDGLRDGYGTEFWGYSEKDKNSNSRYFGEWKNDKKDGFGRYEWADGSYYEGPWKNDEQNGDGVYVFKNGEKFKGHWIDGYCEALAKRLKLE